MEIAIPEFVGFAPECIVSIRAGVTRRQAPVSTLKETPLRFPSQTGCEPLKIDVLQPIVSSRLVLHPCKDSYDVDLGSGARPMGVRLNVRQGAAPSQPAEAEVSDPDSLLKYTDEAVSARQYLETHRLLHYFQGLLQAVIQAKPDDPYAFMWKQLGAIAGPAPRSAPAANDARPACRMGAPGKVPNLGPKASPSDMDLAPLPALGAAPARPWSPSAARGLSPQEMLEPLQDSGLPPRPTSPKRSGRPPSGRCPSSRGRPPDLGETKAPSLQEVRGAPPHGWLGSCCPAELVEPSQEPSPASSQRAEYLVPPPPPGPSPRHADPRAPADEPPQLPEDSPEDVVLDSLAGRAVQLEAGELLDPQGRLRAMP